MLQPESDRLTLAMISGTCARFTPLSGWPLSRDATEAVEAIRTAARGRADLLAQHAGVCLGLASEEQAQYAARLMEQAALCQLAGADESQIARWAEVAMSSQTGPTVTEVGGPRLLPTPGAWMAARD